MFKVNNKVTRTTFSCRSTVFLVNFEHISQLFLVFLLLTLNMHYVLHLFLMLLLLTLNIAAFSRFFLKGYKITKSKQARNKEFLEAGEVGTSINVSCTTYKRKALFSKVRGLSLQNQGTFLLFSKTP